MANALLGTLAIRCVHGAAREVASPCAALAAAALFGCTDILLFSIGTARNDALPVACLAGALWLAVRAEKRGATRGAALAVGLLLASAAAAKISYALPAAAYGVWALARPRHRPLFVVLGALPLALFVGCTYLLSPEGFTFGVWTFPTKAPLDWYADRPWKLSVAAKLTDALKFLALGPALLAIAQSLFRRRLPAMLLLLTLAGLVAALLPTPTWRQYLLPMLPPLFVMLAHRWTLDAPGRAVRIAAVTFAAAGLTPTLFTLANGQPAMVEAMRDGAAIRRALDAAHVPPGLPVATLSPQFLPAAGQSPDARFATGPFYFRSRGLLSFADEWRLRLVSRAQVRAHETAPVGALLVGGEGKWTSGDPALETALAAWARDYGYAERPISEKTFRLFVLRREFYDRLR